MLFYSFFITLLTVGSDLSGNAGHQLIKVTLSCQSSCIVIISHLINESFSTLNSYLSMVKVGQNKTKKNKTKQNKTFIELESYLKRYLERK